MLEKGCHIKRKKARTNPHLVLREEFDDWAVLFAPDSGDAYGMSPTSVLVWKLLDGNHTAKDIEDKVRAYCSDVPDEANEHIEAFICELVEHGYAGYEVPA